MSSSFSVISSNHFQAGTTSTSMPLQSRFINKFSCIILNCKNQIGIYHVANIIDYSLFSQGEVPVLLTILVSRLKESGLVNAAQAGSFVYDVNKFGKSSVCDIFII